MVQNDKKKQAKARRDEIAKKLQQISTSSVVIASSQHQNNNNDQATSTNSINQDDDDASSRFAPIDPNDTVSKKVEEKFASSSSFSQNKKPSSLHHHNHNRNDDNDDDDDDAENHQATSHQNNTINTNKSSKNIDAAASASTDAAAAAASALVLVSNRQRKKATRPDVAVLKAFAKKRPDLVELHDTNAADPKFLIQVKEMRNTIPVPLHWAQKSSFMSHTVDRDASSNYEQSVMPKWIVDMKIGDAWKAGNRFDPTSLMIPFMVGHAAPALTPYGDLFHEAKDMRARYLGFRPGAMSLRLRQALEMGAPANNVPPPWLTGMQKIAKLPPSYPNLKIPGVNAPIPSGARYGRGRNEWGEPPRDPKNNNKFLFEGVDRSLSSMMEFEEAKFVASSRWGTNTPSLSVSAKKFAENGNASSSSSSSGAQLLPSIFTASKEELDAAENRKKAQEEAERQQALLLQQQEIAMQQQLAAAMAAQQQMQNPYNNINTMNNIQIPQYMLASAGIYQNQQQPNYNNQGQFGQDVNTQRNQPGMNWFK